jgi:hypothetical protein
MQRLNIIMIVLLLAFGLAIPGRSAHGADPALPNTIYLPMVMSAASTSPPSGGGGTGGGGETGGATWLPYQGDAGSPVGTFGASIAVDATGGTHAAYTTRIAFDGDRKPAYYAFCAANCADAGSWRRASLSDRVIDARLKLDPAGRPRMLLYVDADITSALKEYQYAECNANCADAGSWTMTAVAQVRDSPAGHDAAIPQYFALDPQGRPRFVYAGAYGLTETTPTYYMACDADCTDANNWSQTEIAPAAWGLPTLAFTPDGLPRLAVSGYRQSTGQNTLAYFECDAGCASMRGVYIENLPNTADYKLALDSQGRPRLAIYTGVGGPSISGDTLPAGQLLYFGCDAGCAEPVLGNWMENTLALPQYSGDGGIDLQLDPQGRPRLAYHVWPDGIGYAWCNTSCVDDAGQWQAQQIEGSSGYVQAPIRWCSISTWVTGELPALALDPQGKPQIAYNAEHGQGGQDRDGQVCFTGTDILWVRFATLP